MTQPAGLSRFSQVKTLLLQSAVVVVVSSILGFLLLPEYGVSLSYGMLIFMVANSYFAFKAFRYQGARYVGLMVRSFMQGSMAKLVIFSLAILLLLKFDPRTQAVEQVACIFIAYLYMQFVFIVLAIIQPSD